MKGLRSVLFFMLVQGMTGCETIPEPDMVVKEWLEYRSQGKCEKAERLEVESIPSLEVAIEEPCDPFRLEIVTIVCTKSEESAQCTCSAIQGNEGEKQSIYDLKKVDGVWKIAGGL